MMTRVQINQTSKIKASVDIGTNTILLLIAETAPQKGVVSVLHDGIFYARLGQGVNQNRAFSTEAMDRAWKIFENIRRLCDQYNVQEILAVATSASRDAKNSQEFYSKVNQAFNIDVKIIDGETEARLSFIGGLLPGQDPKIHAIMDIGGGSTEFVVLNSKTGQIKGQSIDMGSVRALEMFLSGDPYTKKSLNNLENALKVRWQELSDELKNELKQKTWVGVAGTATSLAAVAQNLPSFMADRVDGYKLSRCMVWDMYESLSLQTLSQKQANPLLGTGRADLIVPGAAILATAMEAFERDEIIVSTRGLRNGLLIS